MYSLVKPILFRRDPEEAHRLVLKYAGRVAHSPFWSAATAALFRPAPAPSLAQTCFGFKFAHPLGLAAGLDKNGEAVDFWPALGFSFCEFGTVTPGAGQEGNSRPRIERDATRESLTNWMGFPNFGAAHLAMRLRARRTLVPCGANIGKAAATELARASHDYYAAARVVAADADYLTINVSSPNTTGLRSLQSTHELEQIVALLAPLARNLFIKVAPDLSNLELANIGDYVREDARVTGIIATNTTMVPRPGAPELGVGLSGRPLTQRSLEVTRLLRGRIRGAKTLVSAGGVTNAADAYMRIRAGANLLQLFTALIFQGPHVIRRIVNGLAVYLDKGGFKSITHAIGVDAN